MDTKEITVSDLAQEQIKNAERLFPLIRKKTEERKEKKTQPCTEGYYPSSVVIKGCKTTIYRYREENST